MDAQWLLDHEDRAGKAINAASGIETAKPLSRETFWHFGDDHAVYCALKDCLPPNIVWGETGKRLNEISEVHESAFVNLANGFSVRDWDWWESRNIAERGPYSTSFTADCCRYLLFIDILATAGHHVFTVDNTDMADVLVQAAKSKSVPVTRLGPGVVSRTLGNAALNTKRFLGFARAWFRRLFDVIYLRGLRRSRPVPIDQLAACDVLIAAWTKPGDFSDTGGRDLAHSMGRLPRILRQQDATVGYIALPLAEVATLRDISSAVISSGAVALLPDDALCLRTLFFTAFQALLPKVRIKKGFAIGGHSIEPVARMVLARERFDWRAVNARSLSAIGPYLSRHGCRPKAVFHVYENQTWEKGMRQGMRKALPETRVIGCHQSPLSKLYLNMLPSEWEIETRRWPDVVLSHGRRGVEQLLRAGAPAARVVNAGLFRDGAFLVAKSRTAPDRQRRRMICATGPGFQECLELTAKSAAAVIGHADRELIVNFHPLMTSAFKENVKRFLKARKLTDENIIFSDRPIRELLQESVDAVFYADTNSGFEAISSGAKAINVQRDHALSFDKLPDGLARRVYSVADIAAALEDLDNNELWPSMASIQNILSNCFGQIDSAAIQKAADVGVKIPNNSISEVVKS